MGIRISPAQLAANFWDEIPRTFGQSLFINMIALSLPRRPSGVVRMMALHISGDVKLWAGNLSRAVAPGLDELHASPSSFLPKIGQEFTCWRRNNSASVTGGMAAENVLYDTPKIAVIQIFLDRQK